MFIIQKGVKSLGRGWSYDKESIFSGFQIHGLQPRKGTPCVVKMAVRERQHVHHARFEGRADCELLEAPSLVGVARLETLACINDGDAVRAFDEAPAHGTVGRRAGRTRSKHVNLKHHGNAPQD